MTEWLSADVLSRDYEGIVKIIGGVVAWETVSTLSYEWGVLRKQRPYHWTIWLHLLCQATCALAMYSLMLHNESAEASFRQTSSSVYFISGYLSLVLASVIIALRTIAAWKHNVVVSALVTIALVASTSSSVRGSFSTLAAWKDSDEALNLAALTMFTSSTPTLLVSDLALLLLILLGLMRKPEVRNLGIFRILYRQGIAWFAIAVAVDLPASILLVLDLNEPLNRVLQPVILASLSICATRLYRALSDYEPSGNFAKSGTDEVEYREKAAKNDVDALLVMEDEWDEQDT